MNIKIFRFTLCCLILHCNRTHHCIFTVIDLETTKFDQNMLQDPNHPHSTMTGLAAFNVTACAIIGGPIGIPGGNENADGSLCNLNLDDGPFC